MLRHFFKYLLLGLALGGLLAQAGTIIAEDEIIGDFAGTGNSTTVNGTSIDAGNGTTTTTTLVRRAPREVKYFIDVTSSALVTRWNELEPQGFHLTSISAYGPGANPRYAAVFTKKTSPNGLWAIFRADQARWTQWLQDTASRGYSLTHISVTGEGADVRFAGVADRNTNPGTSYRCGLNSDQLSAFHAETRAAGRVMKMARQYGTSANRLYCALSYRNSEVNPYSFFWGMSRQRYIEVRDEQATKHYWRPEFVSISDDDRYTAIFSNTYRGTTHSDSQMTAAEVHSKVALKARDGLFLHSLQGSGSGSGTTFAGLWSELETQPRTQRLRTGVVHSSIPSWFTSEVTSLIQKFFRDNGVRQGQFALGRSGNVRFERAFTWSEEARRETTPDDRFYLASVSKPFACAAVQTLYNANLLRPSTRIVDVLGLTEAPADARFRDITVDHLLRHRAGYDRDRAGDAGGKMRQMALDMNGGVRPVSTAEVAGWLARQRLLYAPGTEYHYSNEAFLLAGRVVERVTGKEYYQYLREAVLTPEGLDVGTWATNPAAHANDKVVQEDWRVGLSGLTPRSDVRVAAVFGGNQKYYESARASTSLVASASTLVRFASGHALFGAGARSPGVCKGGSNSGAMTRVCSTGSGYEWAVVVNTRDFSPDRDVDNDGDVDDRWTVLTDGLAAIVARL